MNRKVLCLTPYIPKRKIQRSDRINLLAARRIEEGARHILPQPFSEMRIPSDQTPRTLLEQVFRSSLTNSGDSRISFNRNDVIALVEERVGIRRQVDPHPRDFHFRRSRGSGYLGQDQARCRCGGQIPEEDSTVHFVYFVSSKLIFESLRLSRLKAANHNNRT